MTHESCLIAQFNQIIELTETEKDLLSSLEDDVKEFPADTILVAQGEDAGSFFSLRSGWASASHDLEDGSRQVIDIFLGGQIMGLREVGLTQAHATVETMTDVVACPFPRNRLAEVFAESRRLAVLFFLLLARDHAMLTERLANIGSKSATARFAHFILETRARLNIEDDEFEMPFKQTLIGDALGMTSVHVSRVLGKLTRDGLIERKSSRLIIKDMEGLTELGGFNPAYLDVRVDLLLK